MKNDNVFILKFISYDNLIQGYCLNEDVENCIRLNNNHNYVKLVEDMNVGDINKLDEQDVKIELAYKGANIKYIPFYNNDSDNQDLFVNIKKINNLYSNKIYFLFYYKPSQKYYYNSCSNLILNGLKKFSPKDFDDKSFYLCEFNRIMYFFINKFIYKFNIKNNVMLCCVPSHNKSLINQNPIAFMIKKLSEKYNFVDGSQVLIRYKDVEEQKKVKIREKKTHLDSIFVSTNILNKDIILIDDITTSGSSLLACKKMLIDAGANSVICFAFGKTS